MPLSSKQMEYLAIAWACFDNEPKIDYERFRQLAGLKTAASAREVMRNTKLKLKTEYGQAIEGEQTGETPAKQKSTTKKTPSAKKSTGRKRKATEADLEPEVDDNDNFDFTLSDGEGYSPSKKPRSDWDD